MKKKSPAHAMMSKIGALIAEYRFKSGMSGEELAEKLKLSTSVIHQFERGIKMPSLYTMSLIKKELHIPSQKIL